MTQTLAIGDPRVEARSVRGSIRRGRRGRRDVPRSTGRVVRERRGHPRGRWRSCGPSRCASRRLDADRGLDPARRAERRPRHSSRRPGGDAMTGRDPQQLRWRCVPDAGVIGIGAAGGRRPQSARASRPGRSSAAPPHDRRWHAGRRGLAAMPDAGAEVTRARALARRYRLEYVDMERYYIDQDILRSLPAPRWRPGPPQTDDRPRRGTWTGCRGFAPAVRRDQRYGTRQRSLRRRLLGRSARRARDSRLRWRRSDGPCRSPPADVSLERQASGGGLDETTRRRVTCEDPCACP